MSEEPEQEPFIYVREDNEKPFGGYEHCSEADVGAFPVYAVNMSQERVDETAKREHEPWPSVQCVCGGTIYFKHTKREWAGLTDAQVEEIAEYHGIDGLYETSRIDFYRAIEITLKEKNGG